ncbi:MAG: hypothetical protein WDW38_008476 [Sanguina aurantia]
MCTVDKLLIKGIRSFSPENTNVIEFYKPLTIIVGHNGAGKTVANEQEVKAQIKLRFHTSTQQPVVVQRSFSLTQKKAGLTFKTLDSLVQTQNKDTNKAEAVTMRCADIDALIPTMMGVSKAVLESVIFVHQEDSNWPLSEGKVLKEKFDEIFAATKYTKALDVLRKLRTEKVQGNKVLKAELDTIRTRRDQSKKLQGDIEEGKSALDSKTLEMNALHQKLQVFDSQLSELNAKMALFNVHAGDRSKASVQLASLREREQQILAQIRTEEMADDTPSLRDFLLGADNDEEKYRAELRQQEDEAVGRKLQRESFGQQHVTVGHDPSASFPLPREACLATPTPVREDQGGGGRQVMRCGEAGRARDGGAAGDRGPAGWRRRRQRGGGGSQGDLEAAKAEKLLAALAARTQDLDRQCTELRTRNRSKDTQLGAEIEAKSSGLSEITEKGRMKREAKAAQEAAMEALYTQARLSAKQEEERKAGTDALVAAERSALERIQAQVSELRLERESAASAVEGTTRLRLKRQEQSGREEQLRHLVQSKRSRVLQLLQPPGGAAVAELPPIESLRSACSVTAHPVPSHGVGNLARCGWPCREAVERAVESRRQGSSSHTEELKALQKEQQQAMTLLSSARATLARLADQTRKLEARLKAGMAAATAAAPPPAAGLAHAYVHDAALPEKLGSAEQEAEKVQTRLGVGKGLLRTFNFLRTAAQQQPECPLCQRTWGRGDREKALAYVDEQVDVSTAGWVVKGVLLRGALEAKLRTLPAEMQQRQQKLESLKAEIAGL